MSKINFIHHFKVGVLHGSQSLVNQTCGGTLISNKYVVTSVYLCAEREDASKTFTVIGDTILGTEYEAFSLIVGVIEIIRHENYQAPFQANIALLKLEETVPLTEYPSIKPVCLPIQGEDFTGMEATATGWGSVFSSVSRRKYQSWLHEITVTVLDNCEDLGSTQICGETDAPCTGDQGGPLVVSDPQNNNGLTLIGIIDFNVGCNDPATFTKVSLYTNWILEKTVDSTTCLPPRHNNM